MPQQLRAAIIGASGMGKHHAKWLHELGCQVVGFAGSSEQSVAQTATMLTDNFPFEGTGYTDVARMLETEHPDLVSIASPNKLHYEHVMLALEHGAHVMCEKPLVHDWNKSGEQLLSEAQEMAEAAQAAGVVAAINTQYAAAPNAYRDLAAHAGVAELISPPRTFFMQMESRGSSDGTDYEQIWIDLAPHPLSVLRALLGAGEIDEATPSVTVASKWVEARFDFLPDDGDPVCCHILVRNVAEGPLTRA